MPPSNRRKKAAPVTNHSTSSDIPAETDGRKEAMQQEDEQKCPGCKDDDKNDESKDTWICCDACKTWYHWGPCAGINRETNPVESVTLDQVDKW